jgi:uncharacterized protein YukE
MTMNAIDDWCQAEEELSYLFKEAGQQTREVANSIRLRAFEIWEARKDHTLDNWLKAEYICSSNNNFENELTNLSNMIESDNWYRISPEAAYCIAKIEYVRTAAYYIYEEINKANEDWYQSERSLNNNIIDLSTAIAKREKKLTDKEAKYKARDLLHDTIREKAHKRRDWISTCAYYLSKANPANSEKENWYIAANRYDTERSIDETLTCIA